MTVLKTVTIFGVSGNNRTFTHVKSIELSPQGFTVVQLEPGRKGVVDITTMSNSIYRYYIRAEVKDE